MKWFGLHTLFLALTLFLVATGLRVATVASPEIQSDERLWSSRSFETIQRVRNRQRDATTHLGHPGVSPTLIMAAGQWSMEKLGILSKGLLNRLESARLFAATYSSLAIVLLFLVLKLFIATEVAFLTALFFAFDPRHIAYSRLAHLDGSLTVFALAAFYFFYRYISERRTHFCIFSGLAWGLAIAAKPTAILLIPICWFTRVLNDFYVKRERIRWMQWSDLSIVLIGHLALVSIYTRLWIHNSDYRLRLGIENSFADLLFRNGKFLKNHDHYFMAVLAGLLILYGLFAFGKRCYSQLFRHAQIATIFAAVLVTVMRLRPAILENITRFWTWVFSLSGESHDSFGVTIKHDAPGYLSFLCKEVPDIALIALLLGLGMALFRFLTKRSQQAGLSFIGIVSLFALVLWFTVMGVSDKQTWRYALPVVPFVYMLVGVGLMYLSLWFSRALPYIAVLASVGLTLPWHPFEQIFFNQLSGGLAGAYKRDDGYLFAGQAQAAKYLVDQSNLIGDELFVSTVGDSLNLAYAVRQLNQLSGFEPSINFGYYRPSASDYFLLMHSHDHYLAEEVWGFVRAQEPVYVFKYRDVPLVSIYKIDESEQLLSFPIAVDYTQSYRKSGKLSKVDGDIVIEGLTGRDQRNYLFFTSGYKLDVGMYSLEVPYELIEPYAPDSDLVLRMELGEACEQTLRKSEILPTGTLKLTCVVNVSGRRALRLFWYATQSIRLYPGTLYKIDASTK